MSLALSDDQMTTITNLARPLQPAERQAFLAALFEELIQRRHDVGEGELSRLLRDLVVS